MRMISFALAALLVTSGAPAMARQSLQQRGEAQLAKELQGRVAGKPQKCLDRDSSDSSYIIDGTAIVYRTLGNKIYVNRPNGAAQLRDDDIPVLFVTGSQLCRLDRVKLLDRSTRMDRGFVRLGDFVPYTKPAKH